LSEKKRRVKVSRLGDADREKKIREIAEIVYAENKKKGLPSDPIRDWNSAEEIYKNKVKYLLFWKPMRFVRAYYYKLIALAVMLIVFLTAASWKVEQNLADIKNRPYLSTELINPVQISEEGVNVAYYGNYILLKNNGIAPATNVTVSYYITTDIDGKKAAAANWFNRKAEGISMLGFVAPGALVKEPGFRPLSPEASYCYFETVVSYNGLNPVRRYWTHIKRVFRIDRQNKTLIPVFSYADWDNNKNFVIPELSTDKDIWKLLVKVEKR